MGGFCRRCGDIIRSDARCAKCGGSSVSSQVSRALFESPAGTKPDRWLRTYAGKDTKPAATGAVERPLPEPRRTVEASQAQPSDSITSPPTSTPNSPSKLKRGMSVKAAAQAHVRSVTAAIPSSVPLSADEEAVLSNVFGSCLDPHESRGRCGMCREIFRRDSKIYPDPRRDQEEGFDKIFYCRPCYAENFARGRCGACGKNVVGDEQYVSLGKEGSRGVWHKPCFRCTHCRRDISDSPSVGFAGEPCCEECFDRGGRAAAPSSVTDIPDMRTTTSTESRERQGVRPIAKSQGSAAMRPAVDELRKRLRSVGLDDRSPIAKKAASTPASTVASTRSVEIKPKSETTAPPNFSKPSPRPPLRETSLSAHPPTAPPRPLDPSANPLCFSCKLPLFRSKAEGGGSVGDIVTVPTTHASYHASCLRCDGCGRGFRGSKYVEDEPGKRICVDCVRKEERQAWEERERRRKESMTSIGSLGGRGSPASTPTTAGRWKPSEARDAAPAPSRSKLRPSFPTAEDIAETPKTPASRPALSPRIASSPFFASASPSLGGRGSPRLGGQTVCPGCGLPGTMSETKLGPAGERWHGACLRCFACRKPLDSGAKRNAEGKVGCRNCIDGERVAQRGSPLLQRSSALFNRM